MSNLTIYRQTIKDVKSKIFIDGVEVGKIGCNTVFHLPLTKGMHTVVFRTAGSKTKPYIFIIDDEPVGIFFKDGPLKSTVSRGGPEILETLVVEKPKLYFSWYRLRYTLSFLHSRLINWVCMCVFIPSCFYPPALMAGLFSLGLWIICTTLTYIKATDKELEEETGYRKVLDPKHKDYLTHIDPRYRKNIKKLDVLSNQMNRPSILEEIATSEEDDDSLTYEEIDNYHILDDE